MSGRGPVIARYEVSASDQRGLAILRGSCALLAGAGALAMLFGKLPVPLFLVALLALVLSVAWLAQARRLSRAAHAHVRPALVLYQHGFALEEPEGPADRNAWLAFRDVARIEVDEERLDIVVTRRDGSVLRIEPRYQGVDLYELVRTLTRLWREAASENARTV